MPGYKFKKLRGWDYQINFTFAVTEDIWDRAHGLHISKRLVRTKSLNQHGFEPATPTAIRTATIPPGHFWSIA